MTIATLAQLAAAGVVRPDERVVAYVTGNGLKTIEAVAPYCGPTATIAPTLDAFAAAVDIPEVRLAMAVTVRIPTQLRPLAGGSSEVSAEGATVAEVLKALEAAHPGFADRLFDDTGQLRRFVNVFVADEDIRFLDGVDTPVPDGRHPLDRPGRRRRLKPLGPVGRLRSADPARILRPRLH